MTHRITLLPGDGIGPEVTAATLRVLEARGVAFEWDRIEQIGTAAVEEAGEPLPDEVLDSIRSNGVALKGPIATPVGKGFRSVNVQLRQKLDLYASVRPAQTLPGVATPFKDINLFIFRENTEGIANPTALLRSSEMMLRHLGEADAADALDKGLSDHFADGKYLTRDLGGSCSTSEFAERLADRVAGNVGSTS